MKRALLFSLPVMLLLFVVTSCSDDDGNPTPNTNNTNNTNNNNPDNNNSNNNNSNPNDPPAQFVTIDTDPSGDAGVGLDATMIEFKYDKDVDELIFRITTTNLSFL